MKQKLVLSPQTFVWNNKQSALFYGSHNGEYVIINDATSELIILCETIKAPQNLYSIDIDLELVSNSTKDCLCQIVSKGLGKVVDSTKHIVSLAPILSIQDNIEKIKNDSRFNYRLMDFLHSICFYVGGDVSYGIYSEQYDCPIQSEEVLSVNDICSFLQKCSSSHISEVCIVISKIDLNYLDELLEKLVWWKDVITISFLLNDDTLKCIEYLNNHSVKQKWVIDDYLFFLDTYKCLSNINMSLVSLNFIVRNEPEYRSVISIISKEEISKIKTLISPVASDSNMSFIKNEVQLTESEILSSHLSKREIFIHQSLNINDWGKFVVRPNQTVSVRKNSRSIGVISDSVFDLITNALSDDMWLNIRNGEKCSNCIYRWLCPSPTPIEEFTNNHLICTFK